MTKKFALLIGSREFEDNSLARLSAPWEDVETLGNVLAEVGGFTVEKQADLGMHDVRKAIERHFKRAGPDDTALLYYTGHGLRDANSHDLYLALRRTDTELLRSTSLEAAFIRQEMRHGLSKRQVLIFDCCHSGAFMAEGEKRAGGQTLGQSDVLEPGGTGQYVLTASAANESAFERDGKSIYTEFMVEALRTGAAAPDKDQISLDDLHDYLVRRVAADEVSMRPQIWKAGVNTPLIIARNPDPRKPVPPELVEALFGADQLRAEGAIVKLLALRNGPDARLAKDAGAVLEDRLRKTDDLLAVTADAIRIGLGQSADPGGVTEAVQDARDAAATEVAALQRQIAQLMKANRNLMIKSGESIANQNMSRARAQRGWRTFVKTRWTVMFALAKNAFRRISIHWQALLGLIVVTTYLALTQNLLGPLSEMFALNRNNWGPLAEFTEPGCTGCPTMIVIPGGTFTMGSPESRDRSNEKPQQEVTISTFALAQTEVTFLQWSRCVDSGGCQTKPMPGQSGSINIDQTVGNVSWYDAMEYIDWLNEMVVKGDPYHLPSESEWEYAARGTKEPGVPGQPVYTDAGIDIVISSTKYPWGPHWKPDRTNAGSAKESIGAKNYPPNGFGLFDMVGSRNEWAADCYEPSLDGIPLNGSPRKGDGQVDCQRGVLRGGSYFTHTSFVSSAFRAGRDKSYRTVSTGFRPARTLP